MMREIFDSPARPVATVKTASLQNVFTCFQLHTLCNNCFVAKNHQQAVLKQAHKLTEMNKPWKDEIDKFFGANPR